MSIAEANAEIARLRFELSEVDTQLASLNDIQEASYSEMQQLFDANEAAHEAALATLHGQIAEELEADVILTNHYKDTANAACVSALMDQQDEHIMKEHEEYKLRMLAAADGELARRQRAEEHAHEQRRQRMLAEAEVDFDMHTHIYM